MAYRIVHVPIVVVFTQCFLLVKVLTPGNTKIPPGLQEGFVAPTGIDPVTFRFSVVRPMDLVSLVRSQSLVFTEEFKCW